MFSINLIQPSQKSCRGEREREKKEKRERDEDDGEGENKLRKSQLTDKVVWYCRLLKDFPQFVVIHKVKSFGVPIYIPKRNVREVNKKKIRVLHICE